MKYGVISDIHSNLPALKAVLDDMGAIDQLWCLGDIVGYGPYPNECIEMIRGYSLLCVAGNHDCGVIGELGCDHFHKDAMDCIYWTRQNLTPSSLEFLKELPIRIELKAFLLVHGSPFHSWEYLDPIDYVEVSRSLDILKTRIALVGHTHQPTFFTRDENGQIAVTLPGNGDHLQFGNEKVIANPGGVGQPRYLNPRAAYAIVDDEAGTILFRRVDYPIDEVQQAMRAAALPIKMIKRLSLGR